MKRVAEAELMEGDDQARVYAEADFSEPHNNFIVLFQKLFSSHKINGYVLDLGCGPADIAIRFANAHDNCIVHGIDGSEAMLFYGKQAIEKLPKFQNRVKLFHKILPTKSLPNLKYNAIICNSLLHHLSNPQILWDTIKCCADSNAPIFVMDLKRPDSQNEARILKEKYASNEPVILQNDFYNSLLAAYQINEVKEQLKIAKLEKFRVKQVSDRHLIAYGYL